MFQINASVMQLPIYAFSVLLLLNAGALHAQTDGGCIMQGHKERLRCVDAQPTIDDFRRIENNTRVYISRFKITSETSSEAQNPLKLSFEPNPDVWPVGDGEIESFFITDVSIASVERGYFAKFTGPKTRHIRKILLKDLKLVEGFRWKAEHFEGLEDQLKFLALDNAGEFDTDFLLKFKHLKKLEISNAPAFRNFDTDFEQAFAKPYKLTNLTISNTGFVGFHAWTQIFQWSKVYPTQDLDVVLIDDSNLHCDSRLEEIRRLYKPTNPHDSRRSKKYQIKCSSPEPLKGRWLKDIEEMELPLYEQKKDELKNVLTDKPDMNVSTDKPDVNVANMNWTSIGVGISVIFVLLILAVLIFFIIRKKKNTNGDYNITQQNA